MKFIKNEMLSHIGLCCHPAPQKVLVINGEGNLNSEIEKHNVEIVEIKNRQIDTLMNKNFDLVVICDMSGVDLDMVFGTLTDKGILLIDTKMRYYENIDEIKNLLEISSNPFIIGMPYTFEGNVALFCSKKYHPTADIILQKSDLLEGLEYYNCDVHLASFALPTGIKKSIIKVLKH